MIDLEPWHDLFVMTGGAAAALVGLLFVAVSLNLDQVLQYGALPHLAAQTVALLVGLVVLSLLVLAPGQRAPWFGAEVLVLAVVLVVIVLVPTLRGLAEVEQASWRVRRVVRGAVATLPLLVAGALLLAASPAGMAVVLVAVIATFVIASLNAWVLLIEIRR